MKPLNILQKQLGQLPPLSKIVVACSGGVDSLVLAHMLKTLGHNMVLAHFNHGWRGKESDADEQFVRDLAKIWNLPFEVRGGEKAKKGNAEDGARRDRYAFLEDVRQKHQAQWMALAHHRDDQIETILMHQKRGAGLRGLSGMPFKRGHLLRPLLEMCKADLIDYAKTHQLHWREDSSNQNLNFTRNQLRQVDIPKLKAQDPEFEEKLLKKSRDAQKKLTLLQKKARDWTKSHFQNSSFDRASFSALDSAVRAEICIQLLGPLDLYRSTLKRLDHWIQNGASGTQLKIKGQTFWQEQGSIHLEPLDQLKAPLKTVQVTSKELIWGSWMIQNTSDDVLFVRAWKKGDRFWPSGMQGSQKIQDFFVNRKIPLHERSTIPLILNEQNKIVSIASWRIAQGSQQLKTTLKVLKSPNRIADIKEGQHHGQ